MRQSLPLSYGWHPRDCTWGFSYKWDTDIALEVLRSDLQIWGCRNPHADACESMEPFKMRSFFRHGSEGREKSQWTGHRICNQTKRLRMSGAQGVIQHDQTTVSRAGE